MNESSANLSRDEAQSALFAQLVMQLSNMAIMLLGKSPHPETGKPERDLPAARMFIDQLEMLEAKTEGNLSREEQNFLKQTLMSLRMSFVEAANQPEGEPAKAPAPEEQSVPPPAPDAPPPEAPGKRFSKSYPS